MRPRKMTRIIRGAAPTASTSASAQGTASTPQHRSLLMAPGGWSVSVSPLTSSSRSLLSSPVHARQDDVDDNLPAESRPPASPTRRRAPRGLDQSAEGSRYAPPVPTSSKRSVPKPPRRSLAAPVLINPKLTLKFADGTSETVDMHPDSIRNSPSLFRPRKLTDPPPRITIIRNKPGMLPGTARPSPSPVVSISVSATTASTATSIRPPRDSTNPAAMVSSLAPSTVLLAPPLASASVTPRVFIAPPEPMAPPPSPPPGNGWASAQRWIRAHADEPFFVASSSRNRKNKTDKRNRAKNKKLKRRPRIDKTRTARNSDSSPTESTITTHVRVDPQRSGAARRPGRIPGDPTGVVRCDPEGLAGIRLEELALYDSIAAHGRKMWEFKQAKEQDREESARMEDMMETTAMEVRRSINDHGLALDVDSVDGSSTSTLAESSRQVPDTATRELQMRTDPLRDFHLPEGPDPPEEPDALPATRASLGEQGAMANPWFYVYTVIRMAERHQLCAWVHISAEDVPRIEKGMKDCKAQGCGMCHELVLKNHEWWVAIMDEEDKEHLESFIVKRELEEDGGGAYDLIRWGADPEEIDKGVTARKKVGQYMTGLFHGFVVWFDALT